MTIDLEEETIIEEEIIDYKNFLGNSLLASVLNDKEKAELFSMVQDHKYLESKRRQYALSMREGLTSFFMDTENLKNLKIRGYLGKLNLRKSNRVFINCSCDNGSVEKVQRPQLESGYRDRRYFMCKETNKDVAEEDAKRNFEEFFLMDWATLFRGIYDAVVCPKGYNCSRAEQNVAKLLDKFGFVSKE